MGNWDRSKDTIKQPVDDLAGAYAGFAQLAGGSPNPLVLYAASYQQDELTDLLTKAGLDELSGTHLRMCSLAGTAVQTWAQTCAGLVQPAENLVKVATALKGYTNFVTDAHLTVLSSNPQYKDGYYAEEFSDIMGDTIPIFRDEYLNFYEKASGFVSGGCDDVRDALQLRVRHQQGFLELLSTTLLPQDGARPIADDSLAETINKEAEAETQRVGTATEQMLSIVASAQHAVRFVVAHANTVLTTGESLQRIVQNTVAELRRARRPQVDAGYTAKQKAINEKVVKTTSAQRDEEVKASKVTIGAKYADEDKKDFRGGTIPVVTIYYSDDDVQSRTISLSAPHRVPPGDPRGDDVRYALFPDGTVLTGEWGYVVLDGPRLVLFEQMEGGVRYPDGKVVPFKRDDVNAMRNAQLEWQNNGAQIVFAHHSSPGQGKPVQAAGTLFAENGLIRKLTNISGHYTPNFSNVAGAADSLWEAGLISVSTKIVTIGGDVDDVRNKSSIADAAELQELAKKMPTVTDGRKEAPYSQVRQAGSSLTTNAAAQEMQNELKKDLKSRTKDDVDRNFQDVMKVREKIVDKLGSATPFNELERRLLRLDPALLEATLASQFEMKLVNAFAEARLGELYPKS